MNLKKIALATAIAAAPLAANALEALDDEFLGDVTGQEGITIDKEYINTIEEFQYVDADGDGTSGAAAGKIVVEDITINSDGGYGTGLNVVEEGMMIDATANGVLITAARVKDKDLTINAIRLGSGVANSVGTVAVLNQTNEYTTAIDTSLETFLSTVDSTGAVAGTSLAGNYLQGKTRISSKTAGTGVVIESSKFSSIGEVVYVDHDDNATADGMSLSTTSNTIRIQGITSFRVTGAADAWDSASQNLAGGSIQGAYSKTTIDVVGGKLELAQTKIGSTIVDGIVIGNTGSIGSLAILGNTWVGTTSIYAH